MNTYNNCKEIILRKIYKSKEDIQSKLDVFLLNDRVTQAEYEELSHLLNETV